MSLVTDLAMAFVVGIVAFTLGGVIVGRILPARLAESLSNRYASMAMAILGRGLLIKRQHGGYSLKASTYDPRVGAGKERVSISGKTKWYEDPEGRMSLLAGRPFGLAHESRSAIVDARDAGLAERYRQWRQQDDWKRTKGDTEHFRAVFPLTEGSELVDLDETGVIVQGNSDPGAVERVLRFIELSQNPFNSSKAVDYLIWLAAIGVPFGLMLLASKVTDGQTGGSSLPTGSPLPGHVATGLQYAIDAGVIA